MHISEIAHESVGKVEDFLKEGDEVDVKVLDVDKRQNSSLAQGPAPASGRLHFFPVTAVVAAATAVDAAAIATVADAAETAAAGVKPDRFVLIYSAASTRIPQRYGTGPSSRT